MTTGPLMVLIAGPNGAGKSTAAPSLLRDELAVEEFVNADTIASGLSAFRPESVALTAGRLMLERIRQLAAGRASFAFETTLASRSFAPWIVEVRRLGYHVHLMFLVLESANLAASRVAERVRMGGHAVPEPTIRRRRPEESLSALSAPGGHVAGLRQLRTRWPEAARLRSSRIGHQDSRRGSMGDTSGEIRMSQATESTPTAIERVRDDERVQRSLVKAVRAALREHKRAGNPIAVGRDGQVVWLAPEEIPDFGPDE